MGIASEMLEMDCESLLRMKGRVRRKKPMICHGGGRRAWYYRGAALVPYASVRAQGPSSEQRVLALQKTVKTFVGGFSVVWVVRIWSSDVTHETPDLRYLGNTWVKPKENGVPGNKHPTRPLSNRLRYPWSTNISHCSTCRRLLSIIKYIYEKNPIRSYDGFSARKWQKVSRSGS